MGKNIAELGPREAKFISLFASKNNGFFNIENAISFWKNKQMAYDLLWRLQKKGWIERIEKGKYLVIPLEAGPQRQWSADTFMIAAELVNPSAIAYWTAIRHWNWTEQIPRIIYVQTTKRKSAKGCEVFGVHYEFVTVNERKFFGNAKEWRNGKVIFITDKEKTLIDCADDVERAGGIEELVKAIKSGAEEISWKKLDEYVNKFPNGAVKKRLGYLFETFVKNLSEEAQTILESWQKSLSAGINPLQPMRKKSGKISTRWRVIGNVSIR